MNPNHPNNTKTGNANNPNNPNRVPMAAGAGRQRSYQRRSPSANVDVKFFLTLVVRGVGSPAFYMYLTIYNKTIATVLGTRDVEYAKLELDLLQWLKTRKPK